MNPRVSDFINKMNYNFDNIIQDGSDYDYNYVVDDETLVGFIVVDETQNIKELHKKFWNQNVVPLSVVFAENEIVIFNNFDYRFEKAIIERISDENKSDYSINNDSIYSGNLLSILDKLRNKKFRVDEVLLRNLEDLAVKIHDKNDYTYEYVCNAISWCIFIKYLEDRHILTSTTFNKFDVESFIEILETNKLHDFSIYLNRKLNGNLKTVCQFDLEDFSWTTYVANFFRGDNIRTGQTSLFMYDFSIIPVELISNIYEKFLNLIQSIEEKKKLGNFYTPYNLAQHVIDSTFNMKKDAYSILDPSCGSGVFLVLAYKKICNNLSIESKKREILVNQIHGIDVNLNALKIAVLSLYIAFLDSIDPKDIEVSNIKLPELLGTTLIHSDYFNEDIFEGNKKFDLIVGNPPWFSVDGEHLKYVNRLNYQISDKQIAQSFLYKSSDLLSEGGISALIVTNSVLFSKNSVKFRKMFFGGVSPRLVVNLQNLKSKLFSSAQSPASVIYFDKSDDRRKFGYYLYQSNLLSRYTGKIFFDSSQIRYFDIEMFRTKPELWEKLSFASNVDFEILEKLEKHIKLIDVIKETNIIFSQGYAKPMQGENEKNRDLVGLGIFKDDATSMQVINDVTSFERVHDKRIYHSDDKLLISRTTSYKKYENIIFSKRVKQPCVFNNKYYALAIDKNQSELPFILDNIELLLNSNIYLYYQYLVSEAWKNTHPEIRMERIKNFPVPKDILEKKFHSEEEILYSYGLTLFEQKVIENTCNIFIKNNHLKEDQYIGEYLDTINGYFRELTSKELVGKYYQESFYSAVKFTFVESKDEFELKNIDDVLGALSIGDVEKGIITSVPIYILNNDGFIVVKARGVSNWNLISALLDIDKIIKEIMII